MSQHTQNTGSISESHWVPLVPYIFAMIVVVVSSNILVAIPFDVFANLADEDWLTWGAFTYPVAFLVTDLANRNFGPAKARLVVYVGFALAVLLSIYFADARIAVASGTAFLTAQLLDVFLFSRLREKLSWWAVPAVSSTVGSVIDTALFFSLAFAGSGLPWTQWALGDLGAKLVMVAVLLLPYRLVMQWTLPRPALN